jgi:hypothetical protein
LPRTPHGLNTLLEYPVVVVQVKYALCCIGMRYPEVVSVEYALCCIGMRYPEVVCQVLMKKPASAKVTKREVLKRA